LYNNIIKILKDNDLLKIVDEPLDIYLEIPHITYVEVKKEDSKAILFTKPIDKKTGKEFDIPVLMNVFCSPKAVELFIGDANKIAANIEDLLKMKPPQGWMDKIAMFGKLFDLKNVPPKRLSSKGECQQIIKTGSDVNLSELPVLTTWEQDGGPFITMGQVYTQSLDGKMQNLGMYRLQVYNDGQLGMHWQINCVPLKDVNDSEIIDILEYCKNKGYEVRFIEFMENSHANVKKGLTSSDIQEIIKTKYNFSKMERESGSPSRNYLLEDGYKFGIIEPHLDDFCRDCNRIRLTAEGYLIPCLYFEDALSIADAVKQKDIKKATNILKKVLQNKPEKNKWGEENNSNRAFYETGG
jgi:hypothetical protein